MSKYDVEFCSFNEGEWYTKTSTDNYGAACSVAECSGFGRIGRVIDNDSGETRIFDNNVDWGRYESNGIDVNSLY